MLYTEHKKVNVTTLRHLVAALIPALAWRWHGIGLLQGYVAEGGQQETRVHIWDPCLVLPGIAVSGDVHNHRFRLRSTVLEGQLEHKEYRPVDGVGWQAWDFAHAREHTPENRAAMRLIQGSGCDVETEAMIFGQGTEYTFEPFAFHHSRTDRLTVTLCEKTDQVEMKARVLAPVGTVPVPAFSQDLPPGVLDRVLARAVSALK